MDDNSFAALVGKLNQIDSSRKPHEKHLSQMQHTSKKA